jgi:bacterioferritin (cytochrome b1)
MSGDNYKTRAIAEQKAIDALQSVLTDEELICIRDYSAHWRLINAAIREEN